MKEGPTVSVTRKVAVAKTELLQLSSAVKTTTLLPQPTGAVSVPLCVHVMDVAHSSITAAPPWESNHSSYAAWLVSSHWMVRSTGGGENTGLVVSTTANVVVVDADLPH